MGLIIWVAISMTAQAEADDGISPAQVATDCTHGGPYKDQDVWVFDTTKATPSDATNANPNAMSGDIANTGPNDPTRTGLQGAELSATFEGPHGPSQTKKINSRVYDLEGHSIAWTSAPAGWRLVATIPADLRLVGTCQAERVAEAIGINPKAAINEPAKANDGPAAVKTETLPQTGQDVGAMVTLGAALVGTGVMLLFVRRKRPSPPPPRHRASDRVWTYPAN